MIIYTSWTYKGDHREPNVPFEVDGYIVHFELGANLIAEVYPNEEDLDAFAPLQVDNELNYLFDSARGYLPALAIAKACFEIQSDGISESEFVGSVKSQLERALHDQPTSRATIVRSRSDEVGYRSAGEFVWALRVNANSQQLTWIASDGCVYIDDLHTFEVSETQLHRLSQ